MQSTPMYPWSYGQIRFKIVFIGEDGQSHGARIDPITHNIHLDGVNFVFLQVITKRTPFGQIPALVELENGQEVNLIDAYKRNWTPVVNHSTIKIQLDQSGKFHVSVEGPAMTFAGSQQD